MVTIKCQHSGIEFEATSARTKQHPIIAEMKNESNKKGNYREMNQALDRVAKAGGYITIEEYVSLVKADLAGQSAKADAEAAKHREYQKQEDARKEAIRQKREEQNATLKANGYVWHVEIVDRDAYALETRNEGKYFYLVSPDGRVVTVEQALDEIARGADVVKAEMTAKSEQDRIEREAKQQVIREEEAKKEADRQAYDAIEKQARQFTQVERFICKRDEAEVLGRFHDGWSSSGEVLKTTINGVSCYIVSQYGDMDWTEYYCENPELAGLTVKVQEASTTRRFF